MSGNFATTHDPTERQCEVLDFIRDYIKTKGYPPSIRDIGEAFEILSPNGVLCHLLALERKGLIERDPNISRGIRVLN